MTHWLHSRLTVTCREAAAATGLRPRQIESLWKRGELQGERVEGVLLIRADSLRQRFSQEPKPARLRRDAAEAVRMFGGGR